MKKRIFPVLLALHFMACSPFPVQSQAEEQEIFYDDFSGSILDSEKWLVAYKNWGGTVTEAGITKDDNGGVIPENVSLKDGKLILTGYGNQYTGDAGNQLSLQYALCTNWIGEGDDEHESVSADTGISQADGAFHKFHDDIINIFDFCLMKKILLNQKGDSLHVS